MKTHIKWTEEEDELLKLNYPTLKQDELIKLFPTRTKNAINLHANFLKIRKQKGLYVETCCDFLLKDDQESFYWTGFILADGSISDNRLRITLSIKDKEHLVKLGNKINVKITEYNYTTNYGNGKFCKLSCMDFNYLKQYTDKFNINNNKTYNPPDYYNFEDRLMLSMFIGLIDGDGCIKNQTGRKDCVISIKCHASWLNFYTEFHKFLDRYFGLKSKPPKIMNCGYMLWTMADYRIVKGLKKFVIENNLPVLSRKWNIIDLNRVPKTERSRILDAVCKDNPSLSIDELAEFAKTTYASARSSKIRVFGKSR